MFDTAWYKKKSREIIEAMTLLRLEHHVAGDVIITEKIPSQLLDRLEIYADHGKVAWYNGVRTVLDLSLTYEDLKPRVEKYWKIVLAREDKKYSQ